MTWTTTPTLIQSTLRIPRIVRSSSAHQKSLTGNNIYRFKVREPGYMWLLLSPVYTWWKSLFLLNNTLHSTHIFASYRELACYYLFLGSASTTCKRNSQRLRNVKCTKEILIQFLTALGLKISSLASPYFNKEHKHGGNVTSLAISVLLYCHFFKGIFQ